MSDPQSAPHVAVLGGGLAGLAAAAALGSVGCRVTVLESRPFLGGRATSYPLNSAEDNGPTIDNCQHVLLRCCSNLIDFYQRLGVESRIEFHNEFYWIEPGGRLSTMRAGALPAPLHFTESFARLRFLSLRSKLAVGRALLAVRKEYGKRADLDQITMLEWLREKRQPREAINRFWQQVLVSAVNEDLERMAAAHGLQVFALGFLSTPDAYQMGIPRVPLGDLYSAEAWSNFDSVSIQCRTPIENIGAQGNTIRCVKTREGALAADAYISALPFERLAQVGGELNFDVSFFGHSPITGIHLWFDRPVTELPHATLLDRTIQWMFNKDNGQYVQLVVSASRTLVNMPRQDLIDLAVRELYDFFPLVRKATLVRSHVVKEVRATFSAAPDLEQRRPAAETRFTNFFLAGDWTRSGWPATMEGAVRSGYLAAESVCRYFGQTHRFLIPDK